MEQSFLCEETNLESTKWFLEGLCNEYKTGFDSLKEMLPFCQSKLSCEKMEQFQYEIACVENNLAQLDSYYKSLESIYLGSLTEGLSQPTELNDTSTTDNYLNLDPIDPNYYQLESNVNFNFEPATFDCTDAMNSEKLSLSSMDYLLAIDDSDDFFEFIKSEESADLCRPPSNVISVKSDLENQNLSLGTDQLETKPNKANKSKSSSAKQSKNANGTIKKTRPNESRIWYKCAWEGCSFGSYYNGVVKRHSLKRHSGKIKIDKSSNSSMHRFKCDWPGCEVSLVAYHKLVEHKRKHTGEKPFRCKWKSCNYATARLYSMIIHERTHKLDPFVE